MKPIFYQSLKGHKKLFSKSQEVTHTDYNDQIVCAKHYKQQCKKSKIRC